MLIRPIALFLTLPLALLQPSPQPAKNSAPPTTPTTTPAPSTPSPAATSDKPASSTTLHIRIPGQRDLDLTLPDLKAMPHRTIPVIDKDNKPVTYSGVLVQDILTKAGMAFGQSLRGPKLREYLLAEASDGYAVVYALPEISTEFSDRVVIVADSADDKPLTDKEGPLKIIVSDEKKHARWVRNLTAFSIHTSTSEKP